MEPEGSLPHSQMPANCPYPKPDQSSRFPPPNITFPEDPILILSPHLRPSLPSGLPPSGFITKTLYAPLLSSIRATCLANFIILDLITRTILGDQYRSLSSSLSCFLHSPVTPSPLGSNILLSTLFSNTLSLRTSLNESDQVSHPYKRQIYIYIYLNIYSFG